MMTTPHWLWRLSALDESAAGTDRAVNESDGVADLLTSGPRVTVWRGAWLVHALNLLLIGNSVAAGAYLMSSKHRRDGRHTKGVVLSMAGAALACATGRVGGRKDIHFVPVALVTPLVGDAELIYCVPSDGTPSQRPGPLTRSTRPVTLP